jgi:hypothetical protein
MALTTVKFSFTVSVFIQCVSVLWSHRQSGVKLLHCISSLLREAPDNYIKRFDVGNQGFEFLLFQGEWCAAHFSFIFGVLRVLMFSGGWSCPYLYSFDALVDVMCGCLLKTSKKKLNPVALVSKRDPLLLRKSGSAGTWTWDLWIWSQELWPLDHRGYTHVNFNTF